MQLCLPIGTFGLHFSKLICMEKKFFTKYLPVDGKVDRYQTITIACSFRLKDGMYCGSDYDCTWTDCQRYKGKPTVGILNLREYALKVLQATKELL